MEISLPYGKSEMRLSLPDSRVRAVLRSRIEQYTPPLSQEALVEQAMQNPIGS
ncbi:MAG: hypothetical protein IJS31_00210 [Oscillospiraceae bacterium]|nr:hypothetical protein [Oscillospiraceae bacterium]